MASSRFLAEALVGEASDSALAEYRLAGSFDGPSFLFFEI